MARGSRDRTLRHSVALAVLSSCAITVAAVVATTLTLASADTRSSPPQGDRVGTTTASLEMLPAAPTATGPSVSEAWFRVVAPGKAGRARIQAIPQPALTAYQRAETVLAGAAAECHLPWMLLAAIGRIATDHGRVRDSRLDDDGVATPPIIGPTVRDDRRSPMSDTDGGRLDQDPVHDRAIGPLHLTPTTWAHVGVDADDDGARNPQDIDDAALATAVLLCSGATDLSVVAHQQAALATLNTNAVFARRVLDVAAAYQADALTQESAVPIVLPGPGPDTATGPAASTEATAEATVLAVKSWLDATADRHWSELRQPSVRATPPDSAPSSAPSTLPCTPTPTTTANPEVSGDPTPPAPTDMPTSAPPLETPVPGCPVTPEVP
ncbi:hypothetical protein [Nocardioides humi]|uniref:Membrane-bound lytic murein transglycosylase B n=1 Tax=Nocardioides humi TaxID=449461 RepID=A0ABN2AKJ7_9ACTN|nr:hypothetical protein [Nocardioides humi]